MMRILVDKNYKFNRSFVFTRISQIFEFFLFIHADLINKH